MERGSIVLLLFPEDVRLGCVPLKHPAEVHPPGVWLSKKLWIEYLNFYVTEIEKGGSGFDTKYPRSQVNGNHTNFDNGNHCRILIEIMYVCLS